MILKTYLGLIIVFALYVHASLLLVTCTYFSTYYWKRFGSTPEIGVFSMTSTGLQDVLNPSELFLSTSVVREGVEGAAVAIILEGSR